MIPFLVPVFYMLIYGSAIGAAAAPIIFAPTKLGQLLAAIVAPAFFTVTFVLVAGMLSLTGRAAIVKGTFPRDMKHPVYGPRRLYGACWSAIYYLTPVYFLCLTVPPLKKMLFRLFGYTGSLEFTIYPNTWLRDLPCVLFEKGSHIASRTIIGTNMGMTDGMILVDQVQLGENVTIGRGALIATGCKFYEGVEIGSDARLGIRSTYKKNAKVNSWSLINHGCTIGEKAVIGMHAYIGLKAIVGDGILVPAGANIPAGARLLTQADVDKYYDSETAQLRSVKGMALQLVGATDIAKIAAAQS